jgi:hypothetical protein
MNHEANTIDSTSDAKNGLERAYEELQLVLDFARVHGIVSDALMDSFIELKSNYEKTNHANQE